MQSIENILEYIVHILFKIIPRKEKASLKEVKIIAHRGWHQGPIIENTIEAFDKALEKNLFGMEFDIRWTKDLVPVIHHDRSLIKNFGINKEIDQLEFQELRLICPKVPTLEEVIERFQKKICLFIELKKESWPKLERQRSILKELLKGLIPGEDFHFMALSSDVLEAFDIYPLNKVGVLVAILNPHELTKEAIRLDVKALTGHFLLLNGRIQKGLEKKGIALGTGYTRSKNVMIREANRGVIWQYTNHPQVLLDAMA